MEVLAYRVFFVDKVGQLFSPVAGLIEIVSSFGIGREVEFLKQNDLYRGFYCFAYEDDAIVWSEKFPNYTVVIPVYVEDVGEVTHDKDNKLVLICNKLMIDKDSYKSAILKFDIDNPGYLYSNVVESLCVG